MDVTLNAKPRPGWEHALAYLERGTVLVIGAAGTGKTPLAGFLTAQLGRGLNRVGQIDADPGQVSIGPAGCLGLALTGPWRAPAAQWFVGDTRPGRRPLNTVVGAARLAERARHEGAEVVILDAPSAPPAVPHGSPGDSPDEGGGDGACDATWELLHHLTLAAGVDQVVAVERNGELRPFLDVVAPRVEVFRVPAPAEEEPEASERRQARRLEAAESRLRAHLAHARPVRFARRRILDSSWTPGAALSSGAVTGLLDENGYCLALGVIEEISDDSVVLWTPWHDRRAVARLQIGTLKARRLETADGDPTEEWRIEREAARPEDPPAPPPST